MYHLQNSFISCTLLITLIEVHEKKILIYPTGESQRLDRIEKLSDTVRLAFVSAC